MVGEVRELSGSGSCGSRVGEEVASVQAERGRAWTGLAIVLLVVLLPLAGAALAGRDVARVFEFPPRLEIALSYATFSWAAAVAGGAAVLIGAAAGWGGWGKGERTRGKEWTRGTGGRFPWWGVAAIVWTGAWWVLAWGRFDWFWEWQRYTFFPLWLGFIVTVNALTEWRTGSCLMRRAPGDWLMLFGVSAVFWWGFEWLNRFVRNWHYLGVQDFGALAYALHATVCFSVVLPAVGAVAEWLGSFDGWRARVSQGPAWKALEWRGTAVVLTIAAAGALVFTGMWPRWFYPALWVAPLAFLLAEPVLMKRDRGVVVEMARGDWTRAATWMVAALICGFFWELWNLHSAAKWIYTVPGVDRWHVFEMPLLGYAGYLPFGLECLLVVERVRRGRAVVP